MRIVIRIVLILILLVLIKIKSCPKKFEYDEAAIFLCGCDSPLAKTKEKIVNNDTMSYSLKVKLRIVLEAKRRECLETMREKYGNNYDDKKLTPVIKIHCPDLGERLESGDAMDNRIDSLIQKIQEN
jgi:hypothetical protein